MTPQELEPENLPRGVNLNPRGGFNAKVVKEGVASREREIMQHEAARQTSEKIMRIAKND